MYYHVDTRLQAEARARGAKSYELVANFLGDLDNLPICLYEEDMDGDDEKEPCGPIINPCASEQFMRFVKQVRESNGYDVDCYPGICSSPLFPVSPAFMEENKPFREKVVCASHYAVGAVNALMGKHYELVVVERVVDTVLAYMLLTLSIRDADANDDSTKTLRAMVDAPYGYCDDYNFALKEWLLIPPSPAPDMEPVLKKTRID